MIKTRINLLFFSLSIIIFLNSCSLLQQEDTATPALKLTVMSLAGEYLTAVAAEDKKVLSPMISWSKYKINNKNIINESSYFSALEYGNKKLKGKDSLIYKLYVKDIEVNGDYATIYFEKKNENKTYIIIIKLYWVGTGWMISDDNLFRANGFFQEYIPESEN